MIYRFYTVYNKYEMIKIGNQTRKKISSTIVSARKILLPTGKRTPSPHHNKKKQRCRLQRSKLFRKKPIETKDSYGKETS